jgi:L-lactate dehydrogenase complex protein LldF
MMRETQTSSFEERYRRALANPQLQRALGKATAKFTDARLEAASVFGADWELLRERARSIKAHTLDHLDYYLEQFATNVEGRGGQVFFASDAAEANRYITGVARERNIRLVVKGKSMLTEEIELNNALQAAGIEALETDLGEYIIQLAGERPSHILAPAIHKTRADVVELFNRKLLVQCPDDVEMITALARRTLRERFAEAGMGVTGVNFAVAESGTLALVENEGNIRLSTSLPRVHIALMGIEKLVPRLADLDVFLALLPRSASGQKMSSYVSLLTGVKNSADEEGPEELHVVILDNGRIKTLADPQLRESLYCIRCGACLNICPVYQKIGGHAYGWVYPGPIGAVLTPQLTDRRQAADLPFASSLCGACKDACPLKINIPDMLLHLRREIKENATGETLQSAASDEESMKQPSAKASAHTLRGADAGKWSFASLKRASAREAERLVFKLAASMMKSASRYQRAARLGRLARKLLGRKGTGGASAWPLSSWTRTRDLPPPAALSFREQWSVISKDGVADNRESQSDSTQDPRQITAD